MAYPAAYQANVSAAAPRPRVQRARTMGATSGGTAQTTGAPAVNYQDANAGTADYSGGMQRDVQSAPAAAPAATPPVARARAVPSYATPTPAPANGAPRLAPGVTQQDYTWANNAMGGTYIGKSGGKQRYLGADGKTQFTNDDRNHAQQQILNPTEHFQGDLADPMSEASLRDRWGQAIDQDGQMVDSFGRDYKDAADATDGYIDEVGQWRPTNTEGFDTSFLKDQQSQQRRGFQPTNLQGFDSTETRGVDLSGVKNYDPTALRGVDTSKLVKFDAGGAQRDYLGAGGGTYDTNATAGRSNFNAMQSVRDAALGASQLAKVTLGDQLEQETNSAARAGRLKTGLLDRDKGRVITRVGEDLNSKILDRSVDAAGIQAQIENANSNNATDASVASLRERGTQAGFRSQEAQNAATLGYKALSDATGYDVDTAKSIDDLRLKGSDAYAGHALDQAAGIDRNKLTAATSLDELNQKNAGQIDDFDQTSRRDYGNAEGDRRYRTDELTYGAKNDRATLGLKRQELAGSLYNDAQDRYGDRVSSERDRIQGKQNVADAMKNLKGQQRTDFINSLIKGGGSLAAALLA